MTHLTKSLTEFVIGFKLIVQHPISRAQNKGSFHYHYMAWRNPAAALKAVTILVCSRHAVANQSPLATRAEFHCTDKTGSYSGQKIVWKYEMAWLNMIILWCHQTWLAWKSPNWLNISIGKSPISMVHFPANHVWLPEAKVSSSELT